MLSSKFLAAALIAACLVSGCTPFRNLDQRAGSDRFRIIHDVPTVVQQRADDCGAAAISTLLAYRGRKLPLESVTQAVSTPKLGGAILPDLENYARLQGFVTRSGRGTQEMLRQQVDAGRPVIVPIDLGFWERTRPHYVVVIGYDPDGFVVHTGREVTSYISNGELSERWSAMNNLYLYLE